MIYARINLQQTNYSTLNTYQYIKNPNPSILNTIYYDYCRHKKFKSVMPIFDSEYYDEKNDIIGYYDDQQLVAFSIIRRYDKVNVEAIQFAWNYNTPSLNLGFKSLENECAVYKSLGYKYLYLGGADEYKSKFDGFEILGPI